jgi:hypothetical protein
MHRVAPRSSTGRCLMGDAYALYPEHWIHDIDAVPPVK